MINNRFFSWQNAQILNKEKRLCFIEATPEMIPPKYPDGFEKIPAAIRNLFEKDADPKDISKVTEFFKICPTTIRLKLEEVAQETTFSREMALQLTDHALWIDALKNTTDKSSPEEQNLSVLKKEMPESYTPIHILAGLTKNQRKDVLVDYAKTFFGEEIIKDPQFADQFGHYDNPDVRQQTRELTMRTDENTKKIVSALEQMMGISSSQADTISTALAKKSLELKYFTPNKSKHTGQLTSDLRSIKEVNPAGFSGSSITPESISPSFLKGALTMGVIENLDMQSVTGPNGPLEGKEREKRKVEQNSKKEIERVSGVVERENHEKSEKLSDTFQNLPGWQKLVLLGGIAYLAWKQKPFAIAIGAMYFGSKFFLGIDEPIEGLGKITKKGIKKASFGKEIFGSPINSQELAERSGIMAEYLSRSSKERLNSSVTTMTLLGDMPLSFLAQYYNSRDGLDIKNQNFQNEVSRVLKEKGMNPDAIRTFLRECPKHIVDLNNALANTFCLIATREGDPLKKSEAEALRNAIKGDETIDDLVERNPSITHAGRTYDARTLFYDLVDHGCKKAEKLSNKTLFSFVQETVYANAAFINRRNSEAAKTPAQNSNINPAQGPKSAVTPASVQAAPSPSPAAAPAAGPSASPSTPANLSPTSNPNIAPSSSQNVSGPSSPKLHPSNGPTTLPSPSSSAAPKQGSDANPKNIDIKPKNP